MNTYKKILCAMITGLILFSVSCTDNFDELNSDPNKSTQATASLLVSGMLEFTKAGGQQDFCDQFELAKYVSWVAAEDPIQYNEFTEKDFSAYYRLTNVEKLMGYANETSYDTYMGFGLFLKAYTLFELSVQLGDIPYSEALRADILTPKYDTQKDVMKQIIADLDAAYNHFSKTDVPVAGDYTDLGGSTDKWKRIVNLTELRVLINLSKKVDTDADLNIKAKFAEVAARPLLESNADNLKLTFHNEAGKYAPWTVQTGIYHPEVLLSDILIDMLKQYDDYRLFYYAAPTGFELENGKTADDWDAYAGGDPTSDFADLSRMKTEFTACLLHDRYKDQNGGEPWTKLGYAQQCFILAEGALRGWLSGSATDYYKKGIEAGMKYTRDAAQALNAETGREITDAYIQTHLSYATLQLTGDFDSDLKKILEQKYIAAFMQVVGDPYLDYRRTGYPVLPINPMTNKNSMTDRFPVRWRYPSKEKSTNPNNLDEAVQRQFNGNDNVNELMWLLK